LRTKGDCKSLFQGQRIANPLERGLQQVCTNISIMVQNLQLQFTNVFIIKTMERNIVYILIIILFCGCNHTANQVIIENNVAKDSNNANSTKILSHTYRKEIIVALYMLGCNDRLKMDLPDNYEANPWKFVFLVDSLADSHDYFARIEANLTMDSFSQDLQDSISTWLFLSKMIDFPFFCDLSFPEEGIIDQLPQTQHLLDKYINRHIQTVESLASSQRICYNFDIINYLFSLSDEEKLDFIIAYYTKFQNVSKIE